MTFRPLRHESIQEVEGVVSSRLPKILELSLSHVMKHCVKTLIVSRKKFFRHWYVES